ncbi:HlyD family secretion protein [bacterium]|nr:HlyD family secretion protein [bacterium]
MTTKKDKNKDVFEKEALLILKRRRRKRIKKYMRKRIIIPVGVVLFFIIFGILAFFNSLKYQSTDDAFIEGRFISVAPKISGQVTDLLVDDNDYVKEGDLLVKIDERDYLNKVRELEGALREAIANKDVSKSNILRDSANLSDVNKNLEFAKKDFIRYSKLNEEGLCTKQQYDLAATKYKQALDLKAGAAASLKSTTSKNQATSANIEKIKAQLEQAKLNLSYTKIYASQEGYISSRSVEKGNYVNIAQPLMSIVSKNIWVVANFKETQLTNMKKGQEVIIKIDTYPNKKFKGHIDSIQLASGAKASLFPPENAVGSYIKVVQRIPVKIVFDEDISDYLIAPGMSVIPRVKIK